MLRAVMTGFIAAITLIASIGQAEVSLRGLGDLPGGGFESLAEGISADGSVVVGAGMTASGQQAFRWTAATGMVSLGYLPGNSSLSSYAYDISADGTTIVGMCYLPDYSMYRGFRWTAGTGMTSLGNLPNSAHHYWNAVSNNGSVMVGFDIDGAQAIRWTQASGSVALGRLPGWYGSYAVDVSANGNVVCGGSYTSDYSSEQSFVWTPAGGVVSLGALPGNTRNFPDVVSSDGSVIFGSAYAGSSETMYRWTQATGIVNLGGLAGAHTTHAHDATSDGKIAVGVGYNDLEVHAFIWDETHGIRNLQSVLETEYGLDLAGWTLTDASGITPDGSSIAGWAINPQGQREAFLVNLPEPGSFALLALFGICAFPRRHRASASHHTPL